MGSTKSFRFLDLPAELRIMIYQIVLSFAQKPNGEYSLGDPDKLLVHKYPTVQRRRSDKDLRPASEPSIPRQLLPPSYSHAVSAHHCINPEHIRLDYINSTCYADTYDVVVMHTRHRNIYWLGFLNTVLTKLSALFFASSQVYDEMMVEYHRCTRMVCRDPEEFDDMARRVWRCGTEQLVRRITLDFRPTYENVDFHTLLLPLLLGQATQAHRVRLLERVKPECLLTPFPNLKQVSIRFLQPYPELYEDEDFDPYPEQAKIRDQVNQIVVPAFSGLATANVASNMVEFKLKER